MYKDIESRPSYCLGDVASIVFILVVVVAAASFRFHLLFVPLCFAVIIHAVNIIFLGRAKKKCVRKVYNIKRSTHMFVCIYISIEINPENCDAEDQRGWGWS